ncbi:hypothetical protein AC791_00380 [Klebsiella sp. RIT-PI-d]|nr:hypothetical protein AC791_00380 [Klebsiella sp. RIT-PI-d]
MIVSTPGYAGDISPAGASGTAQAVIHDAFRQRKDIREKMVNAGSIPAFALQVNTGCLYP